jgi:protoporphyrinogen oxidase
MPVYNEGACRPTCSAASPPYSKVGVALRARCGRSRALSQAMQRVDAIILGAGPSGLTLAHLLSDAGKSVVVVERESEPGGLCRSATVDGSPLDIGGGHFLDVRRKEVLDFVFRFMPRDEWDTYQRVAKINLRGQQIDHPLEANLWQLAKADQVDYLESIAQTGSVGGEPMPESFVEWVRWKLGERIANDYMLPYNRKIWSMDLDRLGTYWLYKLPDVSFRDTLRSCLEGRPYGALPAHGTFLYPKRFGYGEVWRRMGAALGDRLLTGCPVTSIDLEKRIVNGRWQAEMIVSSIPWTVWPKIARVPTEIVGRIAELTHVAIDVDYHPENLPTAAHWSYEPQEDIAHHRKLLRHNFCPGSRGYWTETNALRSAPATRFRHHNEFAYPVNTRGKPEAVRAIIDWASSQGVLGLGRWGTWEHMNSDVAVAEALQAAQALLRVKEAGA